VSTTILAVKIWFAARIGPTTRDEDDAEIWRTVSSEESVRILEEMRGRVVWTEMAEV